MVGGGMRSFISTWLNIFGVVLTVREGLSTCPPGYFIYENITTPPSHLPTLEPTSSPTMDISPTLMPHTSQWVSPTSVPVPYPTTSVPVPYPTLMPTSVLFPNFSCVICPAGTMQPKSNETKCIDCPKGTSTNNQPASTNCTKCNLGQYGDKVGAASCTNCTAGRFYGGKAEGQNAKAVTKDDCDICMEGKVAPTPGSAKCYFCPNGKYLDDEGEDETFHDEWEDCGFCIAGDHSMADKADCESCKAGQYADSDREECRACPLGTYAPRPMDTCLECAAGHATTNTTNETIAKFGRGAKLCEGCNAGSYAPILSWKCYYCPAGKYSDPSAPSCTNCSTGYYTNNTSTDEEPNSACLACASGRYTPKKGADQCHTCPPGQSQPSTGQRECIDCEAGKYQDGTHGDKAYPNSCSDCKAGKYQVLSGKSYCDLCPVGRYQSETGRDFCNDCKEGLIATESGSQSCRKCPSPRTTNGTNRLNCSACIEGYYWDEVRAYKSGEEREKYSPGDFCFKCAPGFEKGCETGSEEPWPTKTRYIDAVRIKSKHYRFKDSSHQVYECGDYSKYPDNCDGGAGAGEDTCTNNAEGHMCHKCKDDYFHDTNGKCVECEEHDIMKQMTPLIIVVGSIILFVVAWKIGFCEYGKRRFLKWQARHRIQLDWWVIGARIIFFDYLVITKFTELQDIDWPDPMAGFVGFLNLVFLDLTALIPGLECIKFDHYSALSVWTLAPIALYFVSVTWALLYMSFKWVVFGRSAVVGVIGKGRTMGNESNDDDSERESAGFDPTEFLENSNEANEDSQKKKEAEITLGLVLRHTFVSTTSSCLDLIALVHTLISVRIFQTFDCSTFDEGEGCDIWDKDDLPLMSDIEGRNKYDCKKELLLVDLTRDCDKPHYKKWQSFAFFVLVLYIFLFPIALVYFKWLNHYSKACKRSLTATPYKHTYWWFDAVDLYYRLAMTGFLLVVSSDITMRIVICIFLSVCFLSVITYMRPFLSNSHNSLMTTGQFVVSVTITSGYVVETIKRQRSKISWMLVIINIAILFIAYWQQTGELHVTVVADIVNQRALNPADIVALWVDGPFKVTLTDAIIESLQICLKNIEHGNMVKEYWHYITGELFPLLIDDGTFLFNQEISEAIDWISLVRKFFGEELRNEGYGHGLTHYEVIEEGWLQKKGEINKSFKLRYVLLIRDTIEGTQHVFYCGSEEAAARLLETTNIIHAKGKVDLENLVSISMDEEELKVRLSDVSGRIWEFKGSSFHQIQHWFDSIDKAMKGASTSMLAGSEASRKTFSLNAFRKVAFRLYGPLLPASLEEPSANTKRDIIRTIYNRALKQQKFGRKKDENGRKEAERKHHAFEIESSNVNNPIHGGYGAPSTQESDDSGEELSIEEVSVSISRVLNEDDDMDTSEEELKVESMEYGSAIEAVNVSLDENIKTNGSSGVVNTSLDESNNEVKFGMASGGDVELGGENVVGHMGNTQHVPTYKRSSSHRTSSVWGLEARDGVYSIGKAENDVDRSHSDRDKDTQFLDILGLQRAMQLLGTEVVYNRRANPSLFAVTQLLGAQCQKRILKTQEMLAVQTLAEPQWGKRLEGLSVETEHSLLKQDVVINKSLAILESCKEDNYDIGIDENVMPSLLTSVATALFEPFRQDLLATVSGCSDYYEDRNKTADANPGEEEEEEFIEIEYDRVLTLKMGPVKKAERISAKVLEYSEDKGEGSWPYAQFVLDVLRCSFICNTAEEMCRVFDSIRTSKKFTIMRLKNKLAERKAPYNIHLNVRYRNPLCVDTFVAEIQLHLWPVYALQDSQHVTYELRRTKEIQAIAKKSKE